MLPATVTAMSYLYRNNKSYCVTHLPAVPHLLVELLKLCHDADAGFDSFHQVIEQDTALTSKVMHLANTPAFRQWKDISDLRRMLIVLGLNNIRTLVINSAVEQFFSQFSNELNQQVRQIWIRSVFCANLCERLARLLHYQQPGEAFLTGLLHQAGILVLIRNNTDKYLQLLEFYHDAPHSFCRMEQELIGTDHCEIGAALVESWNLDSFIADALQFQWAAADELLNAPTLLRILAVAVPLGASLHREDTSGAMARASQLLGLTAETTLSCAQDALEKSASMLSALGMANALSTINLYQQTGALPPDQQSSDNLREAVRQVALKQSINPDETDDLILFVRQIRVSFEMAFPVRQLLFLVADSTGSSLKPVNELNLQLLNELNWKLDDPKSLVVASLAGGTESFLTSERASITDRQLLRILDSQSVCLAPLIHKKKKLGLIALGFAPNQTLDDHDLSLVKLFNHEIAARLATCLQRRDGAAAMDPDEFRKLVHEVGNPLSIIKNYLYVLGKKLGSDDSAQSELEAISEEIDRVGRIMLHARHPDKGSTQVACLTDINRLITDLDKVLAGSLYRTGRIQSVLHLDKNVPVLNCSGDKLKQILINLIKNAVEALGPDGTILLATRDKIFQDQKSYVEITVQDNGPGIDASILHKLFSPVESTKDGHSGLGLTVVNTLVKEMGGSISCCSGTDTGTEFKILLPRTTAAGTQD